MKTSKRSSGVVEKKKRVMIALKPSQVTEVDRLLETVGISRSWLIEQLLDKWIKEQKDEK